MTLSMFGQTRERLVLTRHQAGVAVQLLMHRPVKDVVHEGRLARAGDAGHPDEATEWEADIDVLEVVLACPSDGQPFIAGGSAPLRDPDAATPGEVVAGQGATRLQQTGELAGVHDLPAVLPRPRSDVHDMVRRPDRFLVVLDDDQHVAEVAQPDQSVDQSPVVALVQTDRGFVQHVEHPHEARPDLRRQPDPLSFPAGERRGAPPEREVVEPDIQQEAQAGVDLLEHPLGDRGLPVVELDLLEEVVDIADAHLAHVEDVAAPDEDRQRFRPQAGPLARGTRNLSEVLLVPVSGPFRIRLRTTPLEPRDDPLVHGPVGTRPVEPVLVADVDVLIVGAVHDDFPGLLRQPLERHVRLEAERLRCRGQQTLEVLESLARPRSQRPFLQRQVRVRNHQLEVDLEVRSQPVAALARTVGRVEREVTGSQLVERQPAVGAREMLREHDVFARIVDEVDSRHALRQLEGRLDRVRQTGFDPLLDDEPVDDDVDVVLEVPVEPDLLRQILDLAVDPGSREPRRGEILDQPVELALPSPHHRGEDLEARPLGHLEHLVHDLLRRLTGDRPSAVVAVGAADPGEQQAQIVIDLGDGPNRRPGAAGGRLLVDRDGRRQALDEVDVRLVHLPQELPGVGGKGLHVPPLALGIDGVEGKGGLPGARDAGEHDQGIARELQVDVLEVVLTGPPDDEVTGMGARRRSGHDYRW